jgi:outer membrane protein TolC
MRSTLPLLALLLCSPALRAADALPDANASTPDQAFQVHSADELASSVGLTWRQAAAEALENNPGLKEDRLYVKQGQEQVAIGDAGFYPTISAGAGINRGGGQTALANGVLLEDTPGTYFGSINGSWNLFNGFATLASREQNLAAVESRQDAYNQASTALYQSLGQAFNQLIYDQSNLILLNSLLLRYHADTLYQEQEFKGGLTALWTYEKSQSDEAGVAWQVEQQKYSMESDRSALAVLLGRRADTASDLVVAGALTISAAPQDYHEDLEAMERNNPSMAYYRSLVKEADSALWQAESSRYPTLAASGSFGETGNETFLIDPPKSWSWSAGLNINYELFAGGGMEAAIRQSRLALEQAKVGLADQQHQLTAALLKAWTAYLTNVDRLPSAAMAVRAGVDRFATVGALYQAGREAFLDYEQAESIYSGAQTQQLSNLLSAAQAQVDYRSAVGMVLEDASKNPAP